jgi:hypothetical protein
MPLPVPTFTLPKLRGLVSLKSSTASPSKVPVTSDVTVLAAAPPVTCSFMNLRPSTGVAGVIMATSILQLAPGASVPGQGALTLANRPK